MKKKLIEIFFFAFVIILLVPRLAAPAGMNTHADVSHRAIWSFNSDRYPDWAEYLELYPDALQAGSTFPDWGYPTGYSNASEDAHWEPFLQTAANYIHYRYSKPWNKQAQKLAVFFLGMVSHHIADVNWHSLGGLTEGFIEAQGQQDFNGSFSEAHTNADTGGELLIPYEQEMTSWYSWVYYFPLEDLTTIYRLYGYTSMTPQHMWLGTRLLTLGGIAGRVAGWLLAERFAKNSPFIMEQLQDYFSGGMDDMAIWTGWKWAEYIEYVEYGVPAADIISSPRYFTEPWETELLPLIQIGLELEKDGWITLEEDYEDGGVIFRAKINFEPEKSTKTKTTPQWLPDVIGQTIEVISETPYNYTGSALAFGDFNRDGSDDLVIGSPGWGHSANGQAGRVNIIFGVENLFGHRRINLDVGSPDIEIPGQEEFGRFGYAVAVVDLNADGLADLAVSAPTTGANQREYRGKIFVYFGKDDPESPISQQPDIVISAQELNTNLGWELAAGDVNGDSFSDLVIGSPFAKGGGDHQSGQVSLILSDPLIFPESYTTVLDMDITLSGENDYDWFGYSIAVVDWNDGKRYLLAGAPTFNTEGEQSVGRLYGFETSRLIAGQVDPDFTITGNVEFSKTGSSFTVGDPDGDGIRNLLIGSPTWTNENLQLAGDVRSFNISSLAGDMSLDILIQQSSMSGSVDLGRFGWKIGSPDINNDGIDDLVVTQPWKSSSVGRESGRILFWPGSTTETMYADRALWTIDFKSRFSLFGNEIAFPDFNGDGCADIAASALRSDEYARNSGVVMILITPAPNAISITPSVAIIGSTTSFSVTGTNFDLPELSANVIGEHNNYKPANLEATYAQSLTFDLVVPSYAQPGHYDLELKSQYGRVVEEDAILFIKPDDQDDNDDGEIEEDEGEIYGCTCS